MELTDAEWAEHVARMESLRVAIEAWPATDPNPAALRCEFSRHRTLAHLRAAQETWLQAVLLFAEKEKASLKLPHPWRLFTDRSYELIPWEEHRAAYLADRLTWQALVQRPGLDRNRGGRLSGKVETITSLTAKLVGHEGHHVKTLRA